MNITDYHAKYYAYELTKRCSSDSIEKLAGVVAGAQVDLTPHQVDAALFAFNSPLSKGALLADEVGLGKTIEAGLVLSQKWAERKRQILIIVPSNLRKQWHQELTEKFFLPCRILETKSYNAAVRQGCIRPFTGSDVVICSYQFARNKASDVANTAWDLVVIDEAHRLRNVYKPSNVIANTLKIALASKPKLLLTATPLQNSLLELFGLVSFIDEHTFGDLKSFREQFANLSQEKVFDTLKARLKPICHRTLRRQVTAYVPFTKRHPILEEFTPEESEDRLYDLVTEYLSRENLQALPASQRSLMTLVLRKLLASSTFAIAGALETMANRLRAQLGKEKPVEDLEEEFDQDYESLDETAEEWTDDANPVEPISAASLAAIEAEVADLDAFITLATSITQNAKGKALLKALTVAFTMARRLGAAEKGIIFTESRKTQNYLLRLLGDSPFADGIVLFNGTNTDERSKDIYTSWLARHQGTDRVTGSKSADMRSALVDFFRDEGRIMIATEAGAEGINLQFCSLVVNFDLPWNPQRIEQRIGRCHRYGQKHDVVVVNFLNRKNEADQRVFQLLAEKFKLFEGVFGASDEVLGAIESGVDFEMRINDIYRRCRNTDEIKSAFDQLQLELSLEINEAMTVTRRKLLENFDDEVRDKLKVCDAESKAFLSRFERLLMQLTRHELVDHAEFLSDASFRLHTTPYKDDIPVGLYELPRRSGEAHLYRLNHPLAEAIILCAKTRELPSVEVLFNYSDHEGKVTVLEPFVGQSGWLSLSLFTVESFDQAEDHLIFSAITDNGTLLDEEMATCLFRLSGEQNNVPTKNTFPEPLKAITDQRKFAIQRDISERNARFFETEAEKLDGWADDLKMGLEREIKEIDRQIKEARRAATLALTLEEKLEGQKLIKSLESQRNEKRRSLFDAQDEVDHQRSELIANIEGKLKQKTDLVQLFTLRWRLI
jgi:ERCC4-related helicase